VITKVLSPCAFAKRIRRYPQYNRALAASGIIDAFEAENGRMFYPLHAERQWRDYERSKRHAAKAAAVAPAA
jgi:hypothetical protein